MAFRNSSMENISYDCSDLIAKLQEDIDKMGSAFCVLVKKVFTEGVYIYKNYDIFTDGIQPRSLQPGESVELIKATDLMEIYQEQNKIL